MFKLFYFALTLLCLADSFSLYSNFTAVYHFETRYFNINNSKQTLPFNSQPVMLLIDLRSEWPLQQMLCQSLDTIHPSITS